MKKMAVTTWMFNEDSRRHPDVADLVTSADDAAVLVSYYRSRGYKYVRSGRRDIKALRCRIKLWYVLAWKDSMDKTDMERSER